MHRGSDRPGRTPQQWLIATATAAAAFYSLQTVGTARGAAPWLLALNGGMALIWWGIAFGIRWRLRWPTLTGAALSLIAILSEAADVLDQGLSSGAEDTAFLRLTGWGILAACVGYWVALTVVWRASRGQRAPGE